MQSSTESLPNHMSTSDTKDVSAEHCYVHTCPTQSCTEFLVSLQSAKLQLECQVTELQNEVDYLKVQLKKLQLKSGQQICKEETQDSDDEPRPDLFYCCKKCNGLLPSREDYSKHVLRCSHIACDYTCTYYKCGCDVFQNYMSTINTVNTADSNGHLKKAQNSFPKRNSKNYIDDDLSIICNSPRKRRLRAAAKKLLARWGREVESDDPAVESSISREETQVVLNSDTSGTAGHVSNACNETGQPINVSENIASDTEGKVCDISQPTYTQESNIRVSTNDSDVMMQNESGTDTEGQMDGAELVNTQTVISEKVSKVLQCPQIRKLVRSAKPKMLKGSNSSQPKVTKEEKENLKSLYQKYITRHQTLVNTISSEISKGVYCCPNCPFESQKCGSFHKHMILHETGESERQNVLTSEGDTQRDDRESEETSKNRSRRQIYNQLRTEWAKTYEQYAVLEDNVFKHYQCPNCSYTSRSSGHFGRHFKSVHNQAGAQGGDRWKCDVCEFETSKKAIFTQHKKSHDRPYLCDFCPRRFGNQKNLSDHIMIHTGIQPLKCPHCDYATKQKRCLQEHIRKHTGENLMCAICSFTTVYQAAMTKHILTKHTEKALHPCSECSYITNDRTNLQRHIQIHQKHKDFKCFHCKYEGVTKHDVLRHMRCHTQEKIYYCDRCDFTTAYPGALRTHLMMHLDLKPFKCSLCGYRASQKMRIKHHIQAKHSKSSAVVVNLGIKLNLNLKNFRRKSEDKGEDDDIEALDGFEGNQDEEGKTASESKEDETKAVDLVVRQTAMVDETEAAVTESSPTTLCYITNIEPQQGQVVNVISEQLGSGQLYVQV